MSLRAKLNAIKPLTISLFWEMVDQTAYYKLRKLVVLKKNIGFEKCNTCVERTEVPMVVLIGLVVNLLGVDVHEPAMEGFLALIRYNQLNFKR